MSYWSHLSHESHPCFSDRRRFADDMTPDQRSVEDEDDDEYENDNRRPQSVICHLPSVISLGPLYQSRLSYAILRAVISNRVSHFAVSVPDPLAASCKLEVSVSLSRS